MTLVEALVTLAIVATGAVVAIPAAARMLGSTRGEAGAREMAVTFQALRMRAVSMHRAVGLRFERAGAGWRWYEVEDGNGNGLRAAEVRSGVDATRCGPIRLEDRVERVGPGFPGPGPFPQIPPARGAIADTSDPVQFGVSDIVSFSPDGGSSTGTLYLTDRRDGLHAVVLYGATGRVRVWKYDAARTRWTL